MGKDDTYTYQHTEAGNKAVNSLNDPFHPVLMDSPLERATDRWDAIAAMQDQLIPPIDFFARVINLKPDHQHVWTVGEIIDANILCHEAQRSIYGRS